jgi:hypothetical protein
VLGAVCRSLCVAEQLLLRAPRICEGQHQFKEAQFYRWASRCDGRMYSCSALTHAGCTSTIHSNECMHCLQVASTRLQDVDGPLAFLQDRMGRCMQWQPSDWLEDAQTSELVVRLQSGELLETKELLRPVFKWCKRGCEQQACIEKVSRSLLVTVLHTLLHSI